MTVEGLLLVVVLAAVSASIAGIVVYLGITRRTGRANEARPLLTPEMALVIVMLLLMTLLILVIYLMPSGGTTGNQRRQTIALLITAFGAWIGAGAAYFFGRENLRVASDSILAMRQPSPQERLRSRTVRELNPRPIPWTAKVATPIADAVAHLNTRDGWFITIVDDSDNVVNILNEEDLWRFTADRQGAGNLDWAAVTALTLGDLNTFRKAEPGYKPGYVTVTGDRTVADAYHDMNETDARLAIVLSNGTKPTGFITTGDIRRLLYGE